MGQNGSMPLIIYFTSSHKGETNPCLFGVVGPKVMFIPFGWVLEFQAEKSKGFRIPSRKK
jgi:hypothetical protein